MSRGARISVDGLEVKYGSATVLAGIDLTVSAGECVALMGPSGSGKSTLLACITGTQRPSGGRVQVGSHVMSELNTSNRARIRRTSMGLMFQTPDLLPELSVEENVALAMLFDGVPRNQALTSARASLEAVGLQQHGGKRVDEVSGGEAQRIALARALVRPEMDLLIADEPTASLDAANAQRITKLILSRVRVTGATALLATHDESVAGACDRVVRLREPLTVEAQA